MRRIQLLIGIALAVVAGLGVFVIGKINQPPEYSVVIATNEIAPYTRIEQGDVGVDVQTVSRKVAGTYILSDEWMEMVAEGDVTAIEPLHPGQPLLHEQVVSGSEAQGVTRLAVALDDPGQMILSVPVDQKSVPNLVPGDVIALYFSAGRVGATALVTYTVEGEEGDTLEVGGTATTTETESVRWSPWDDEPQVVTVTTELEMPLAKQIAEGIVYRLNRERKQNPNYGAPGMENEPRYIEGELQALDVVMDRETAEWVVFALAHGQVQVGVLPALARPSVEAGTLPATAGATWTDFERSFFEERDSNE